MTDKNFYEELDEILYDMGIGLELFRIIETEIWEYPTDEIRSETKGVLTLAVDNYEKIFQRLSKTVLARIKEL